jgi:hypothetical protein
VERVYAIVLLGLAFARSLISTLLGTKRRLQAFEENYASDRLSRVTAEERRMLPTLSGCVACGLCDVGPGISKLMALALAGARSMPEYDAAALALGDITAPEIAQAEARCPTRVPLGRLVAFVRTKATD